MKIYRNGIEIILTEEEILAARKEGRRIALRTEAADHFCQLYETESMDEQLRNAFRNTYGFLPVEAMSPTSEHYKLDDFVDAYEAAIETRGETIDTWAEAIGEVMNECADAQPIPVNKLMDYITENYHIEQMADAIMRNCIQFAVEGSGTECELRDILKELIGGSKGVEDSDLDRVVWGEEAAFNEQ